MNIKYLYKLGKENFLFWLSRKIDYPLLPPDTVQINFTFRCNLACKMCSMNEQMKFLESQGRQTEIDSDTFKKAIKETKDLGTNSVLFIGGEPLLREDLFELVGYAKNLGLGTVIVTNGVLLNKDNIEKCFKANVDWLSISIDAASEEVFSRIRGENVLGKIIKNITDLNELKKERGREFPKIVSVCVIMNDNIEELLGVVNLCRRSGIDKVIFQPVVANNIDQTKRDNVFSGFVPPGRYGVLDGAIDKLIAYKRESPQNFDYIGNSIFLLKLIKKYFRNNLKPRELPCYAGYNRLQIVQEGKVYFCVPQEKDEAAFGDIGKDSLKDLWYSKKAGSYRRSIKKCRFPCLQWCSYRDRFIEFYDLFQKRLLFKNNHSLRK